jgi:hypothetical protein
MAAIACVAMLSGLLECAVGTSSAAALPENSSLLIEYNPGK